MNQAKKSKTNKSKSNYNLQWADLKTKKEKYQAEQNSCASNNTGVFCIHAESSFQRKTK